MIAAVAFLLHGCGGAGATAARHGDAGGDTLQFRYARNITYIDYGTHAVATLRNPWDTTRILARYILAPKGVDGVEARKGETRVTVPLRSAVVYTATHNALISELGAAEAVTGVCEPQYIHDPVIISRLRDGLIADCGSSFTPDIERIMALQPDAVLLSPYEGRQGESKLSQMGIPLMECADYMEGSPLARAEWMRFFGRLVGRGREADSLFAVTDSAYNALRLTAASAGSRPRVMIDRLYNGVWNMPGRRSVQAQLIRDAGGENIFDYQDRPGSVALSAEEVLSKAHDADIWLIRYNQSAPLTLSHLGADREVYTRFAPFVKGAVYGCNTNEVNYYDILPFHPQDVLTDMIRAIHPELTTDTARYFRRLKP